MVIPWGIFTENFWWDYLNMWWKLKYITKQDVFGWWLSHLSEKDPLVNELGSSSQVGLKIVSQNSFARLDIGYFALCCMTLRCVNILLVSKVLSKNIHNSSWVQSWREIAGKPKTKTPVDCKMPILWPSKKRNKNIVSLIKKNRVSCWISLKPWPSSAEGTVQFSDHFGRLSWSRPCFKWTDLRKQCQGTRAKMALKQRGVLYMFPSSKSGIFS